MEKRIEPPIALGRQGFIEAVDQAHDTMFLLPHPIWHFAGARPHQRELRLQPNLCELQTGIIHETK
jgi:hypothetical protein